jgi:hypothetical protein
MALHRDVLLELSKRPAIAAATVVGSHNSIRAFG